MLVAYNKFFTQLTPKPRGLTKDQKPIAFTEGGDLAYYIPFDKMKSIHTGGAALGPHPDMDDEDFELMEDDEMLDEDVNTYSNGRLLTSLSGQPWMPVFNDRMTMFIGGIPGAGKTYLAKQMIKLLPTDLPILLFTALEENDGNFDELGKERIIKIKMDPAILSGIKLSEIRTRTKAPQVILLFDDVDQIRNPKVAQHCFAIMNDALANGRGHEKHDGKGDIHVLCTTHTLNNYQKTKYTFENSNYVALFPGSTPIKQMILMFEKVGLDKDFCRKIVKVCRRNGIRSIIIHKVVPMYIIYGSRLMLL